MKAYMICVESFGINYENSLRRLIITYPARLDLLMYALRRRYVIVRTVDPDGHAAPLIDTALQRIHLLPLAPLCDCRHQTITTSRV